MKNFSEHTLINLLKKTIGKGTHYLHEPFLGKIESNFVGKAILKKEVSTYGNYTKKFENEIKKITKSKYAIATINCTQALFIALKVLGVQRDQEVLVPALTFIGTVNAISYTNAEPHFVDSNIKDFGIDCIKLEEYLKSNTIIKNNKCINKKTKKVISAIIPVHIFGHPCNIESIKKISKKYHLKIIEDAAGGLGSYYKRKHLGTFGQIGCISFNGNKIITTGGGGVLITNNSSLAKKIRHLVSVAKIKHPWEYKHSEIGYNFKLPSLNASLGIPQLKKLKVFLRSKRKLNKIYLNMLKNIKGVKIFSENIGCKSNYWLQAIILDKNKIKLKNKILKVAHNNNIFIRPVWKLITSLKPYKKKQKMTLSGSNLIYKSVLNLPSSQKIILEKK